jgi:lysophospholipase L1-like esterase
MADIFCIGDSITQGMWDAQGGWADRLKQHFHKQKLADMTGADGIAVFNWGISADFSRDVLTRLPDFLRAREANDHPPSSEDVYVVAVGANDSEAEKTRDNPLASPEEYGENLEKILEIIQPRSQRLIFVGPTPVDETKTHINTPDYLYWNERTTLFNDVISQFCKQHDLVFIEMFAGFQQLPDWKELLPDGVHPNTAGHEWMFGRIKPAVLKMLKTTA